MIIQAKTFGQKSWMCEVICASFYEPCKLETIKVQVFETSRWHVWDNAIHIWLNIINHVATESIKPKDFFASAVSVCATCKPLNNLLKANLFCHLEMEILAP